MPHAVNTHLTVLCWGGTPILFFFSLERYRMHPVAHPVATFISLLLAVRRGPIVRHLLRCPSFSRMSAKRCGEKCANRFVFSCSHSPAPVDSRVIGSVDISPKVRVWHGFKRASSLGEACRRDLGRASGNGMVCAVTGAGILRRLCHHHLRACAISTPPGAGIRADQSAAGGFR
jgi:hypothetical protein